MAKAVVACALRHKAPFPSVPAGLTRRIRAASTTLPRVRSFSLFCFQLVGAASKRGRTGLECLTKILAGSRRNP